LDNLDVRDLELNEVGWWSHWGEIKWFGNNAWVLTSEHFEEQFFNRGGFIECESNSRDIEEMENLFAQRNLAPCFFVRESCAQTLAHMKQTGYEEIDGMAVMTPRRPGLKEGGEGIEVSVVSGTTLRDWVRVYLLSFYGDLSLTKPVSEIIGSVRDRPEVAFLMGTVEDEAAGALALYRTKNLLGVYCVGTLPEFREKGVAATMLCRAKNTAVSEHRQLVLQTILSDGYTGFYNARGFDTLYVKSLLAAGPRP
jgi:N-acetylglutamate synthase-like GNAT family acetyltransferase